MLVDHSVEAAIADAKQHFCEISWCGVVACVSLRSRAVFAAAPLRGSFHWDSANARPTRTRSISRLRPVYVRARVCGVWVGGVATIIQALNGSSNNRTQTWTYESSNTDF